MGRTVGELKATLTEAEFRSWQQFYQESPFDDLHRYHRPAAMLAQVQVGGDFPARLDWLVGGMGLRQDDDQMPLLSDQFSEADLKSFAALGMKPSRA
ncbi:phage tail assembly protein T [Bordetella bronchiseptica]|uniref:phage tail assembly protein T n=1 Tax=Bordetella bronchiseptica TaxID=518 RepID=UPI0012394328|nr:hypothetical protein [Bordetella bronchiseptica]QET71442.1 hypothetical protein FOB42_14475 [Bordetella bronchiseptica]